MALGCAEFFFSENRLVSFSDLNIVLFFDGWIYGRHLAVCFLVPFTFFNILYFFGNVFSCKIRWCNFWLCDWNFRGIWRLTLSSEESKDTFAPLSTCCSSLRCSKHYFASFAPSLQSLKSTVSLRLQHFLPDVDTVRQLDFSQLASMVGAWIQVCLVKLQELHLNHNEIGTQGAMDLVTTPSQGGGNATGVISGSARLLGSASSRSQSLKHQARQPCI